jgi:protocatechuate 3,4-dioxygenase beta subunit
MYFNADAIFVGKVVGSSNESVYEDRSEYNANASNSTPTKQIKYAVGKISFEVLESFVGTNKETQFNISDKGSTCDFRFQTNQTYLIFAFKNNDGTFSSSICSPTKLLQDAEKDLEFLRNPPKSGSGAKIFGTVYESINDYSEENRSAKEMKNQKIKIQSTSNPKKVYFTQTNSEGKYEVNVSVGNYKISPLIPKYFTYEISRYSYPNTKIIKAQDRHCEELTFLIKNDSKISGKILDSNSKPIENITIELYSEKSERSLNAHGEWATSDKNGNFLFQGIPKGRYFLSLNYFEPPDEKMPFSTTYYPNVFSQSKAKILEINNGTKINQLVYQLPPKLKKLNVEGIVTFADGKPVENAEVKLWDEDTDREINPFENIYTDKEGKFVLKGFEGRKYSVRVIIWKKVENSELNVNSSAIQVGIGQSESEVFTLNKNTPKIKIVLNSETTIYNKVLSSISLVYNKFFG